MGWNVLADGVIQAAWIPIGLRYPSFWGYLDAVVGLTELSCLAELSLAGLSWLFGLSWWVALSWRVGLGSPSWLGYPSGLGLVVLVG